MEVPLGLTDELVVSPEYIRYLVRIANCKMEANKKRMDGFLDVLQSKVCLILHPSRYSHFPVLLLALLPPHLFNHYHAH